MVREVPVPSDRACDCVCLSAPGEMKRAHMERQVEALNADHALEAEIHMLANIFLKSGFTADPHFHPPSGGDLQQNQ